MEVRSKETPESLVWKPFEVSHLVSSSSPAAVVMVPLADAPALYERGTPLVRVTEEAPPFLVVQGTSDNLVSPAESRASSSGCALRRERPSRTPRFPEGITPSTPYRPSGPQGWCSASSGSSTTSTPGIKGPKRVRRPRAGISDSHSRRGG